jgi:NADPH-dependent curcumin reductase CurA
MSQSPPERTSILLVARPAGMVDEACFAMVSRAIPALGPGEVLVRNCYVSVDPYLRLFMAESLILGEPVVARAVGQVVASSDPRFVEGELVWGFLAWETHTVVQAGQLVKIDPAMGPITHAIGVRGSIGLTAWVGMIDIGRPQPGETAVVSAGVGAVGSVAGQLARLAGARAVAIVGGDRKVSHAVEVLGYDAAVDHRGGMPLSDALGDACPRGIDVYFDNVGGEVLDAVLDHLNPGARLAMCGSISSYNGGTESGIAPGKILGHEMSMTWFSINNHLAELPGFVERIAPLIAEGKIIFPEDIAQGLGAVVGSFLGLFGGDNLGKRLVKIADPI